MNQAQLHPSNNLMDIRKFHKKSRTGCARCKRRRIKCDEQKPSCRNCQRHQLECSLEFLTPLTCLSRRNIASTSKRPETNSQIMSPRPLSPIVSIGVSLPTSTHTLQTKELLHHYASALYSSVGENCSPIIWNDTIPRLSLIYPFVLPAMLALSALHLATLVPARRLQLQHISLAHESSALPPFRELMGRLTSSSTLVHIPSHALPSHKQSGSPGPGLTPPPKDETNPHIHALFACASHISYFVVASPTPPGIDRCRIPSRNDTYPHWFQSMRGFMALLDNHWLQLANGPLGPTISRERIPEMYLVEHPDDVQLRGLLGMFPCTKKQGDGGATVEAETVGDTEEGDEAVLKEAISYLRRVFAVTNLPVPKARLAGRTWAGTVSQAYAELVYSRDPRALVILAHYCVLLKRLHDVWYMEGLGVGLLENIRKELSREWQPWLEWPLQEPIFVRMG